MKILTFRNPQNFLNKKIPIPTSKSESNRALIIQALSSENIVLEGLSNAEDTQIMKSLLFSKENILNVGAAGTVMRFLTAYCCIKADKIYILHGTTRMHERPIEELVSALKNLGADINYLEREGFPPLEIKPSTLISSNINIRGDISSQYISALMLIAPMLKNDLQIHLSTPLTSALYCKMTQKMMQHFGAQVDIKDNNISIRAQAYKGGSWRIEGDWSAASYWFMIAAIYPNNCHLYLEGLYTNSLQPDSICCSIFEQLGVKSTFYNHGLILEKVPNFQLPKDFYYDCSNCPDIAQTIACTCAALGINAVLSGLKTLKIKETDRIIALSLELAKFGIKTITKNDSLSILKSEIKKPTSAIETYKDHRMAMAFAPLVFKVGELSIEDEDVVNKSYPNFWQALDLLF